MINDIEFSDERHKNGFRVVMLGASNATISLPLIVHSLRSNLAGHLEFNAAVGHGRSFGIWSSVLFRALPSIRDCHLWEAIQQTKTDGAQLQNLGLITDIGNDLLYGVEPDQLINWVKDCLQRLKAINARVVITLLPVDTLKKLSRLRFTATRMLFFPNSKFSFDGFLEVVQHLNQQLQLLGEQHDAQVIAPKNEWYGFDPIHIKPSARSKAWREILSTWFPDSEALSMQRPSWQQRRRIRNCQFETRRRFGKLQQFEQPMLTWSDDQRSGMLRMF